MITFTFPMAPAEVIEFFRLYYGPTQRAFAAIDDERQKPLRTDLEKHWSQHDRGTGGSTSVDSEYLEVLAVR
jgi:hypothetical protein